METFKDAQELVRLLLLEQAHQNVLVGSDVVKDIESWIKDGVGVDLDSALKTYPYSILKYNGFIFYEEPEIDNIVFFSRISPLSQKDVSFQDIVSYHKTMREILRGKKFVSKTDLNDFRVGTVKYGKITHAPITQQNLYWDNDEFPTYYLNVNL